jgi:probable F420-dependent oxidoreductase
VRISISLSPVRPDGDRHRILCVARAVERLGFAGVSMSGQVLDFPDGSSLDPIALLSTVAGATERVRLLTSVLVAPAYNPVVLANQAATLDVLSGGRFTLGLGVGSNAAEYAALGVPIAERGHRADENIEVMRALWSQRPASFAGRFTSFGAAVLGTKPLTPGGPPIWVGGQSVPALRRALRFADAWIGVGVEVDALSRVRAQLSRLAGGIGRDPASLELNSVYFVIPKGLTFTGFLEGRPLGGREATAPRVIDDLGRLGEAGIGWADLIIPVAPRQVLDAVHWLAAEVVPHIDTRVERPPASAPENRARTEKTPAGRPH